MKEKKRKYQGARCASHDLHAPSMAREKVNITILGKERSKAVDAKRDSTTSI